jgi:hypothetical protein
MKTDLKELWSDRLLAHLIANPSKLKYGQEIIHGDLQRLDYDLGDLHTPYPNIEEYMEFTLVEQVMGAELYKSVWTFETNTSRHQ